MATYHWKSAISGSWAIATDWNPGGGPKVAPSSILGLLVSSDTAVFATGSRQTYDVSTGGLSAGMHVAGDHVNFTRFQNGDAGYGGSLSVTGAAVVTLDAASRLDYVQHDQFSGGALSVDDSMVVDHGQTRVGIVSVVNHGLLVESGSSATISSLFGMTIAAGAALGVLSGATYGNSQPGSAIDGLLVVGGAGSLARLVSPAGSGTVLDQNNARVTVLGPTSGTLAFVIGDAAQLSFGGPLGHGNVVSFVGQGGTLTLDQGPAGDIVGFAKLDALVVAGTVTKALWSAGAGGFGSLKLFDGTQLIEAQAIRGDYAADVFAAASAGGGGSRITVQPAPAPGGATLVSVVGDHSGVGSVGIVHGGI